MLFLTRKGTIKQIISFLFTKYFSPTFITRKQSTYIITYISDKEYLEPNIIWREKTKTKTKNLVSDGGIFLKENTFKLKYTIIAFLPLKLTSDLSNKGICIT